jgi:signal transduction histidine kinase/DNA-binding response OmpR family regulator
MTVQPAFEQTVADWVVGGGEMGKLVRSMDWSLTPLGPIGDWPQSLRTTVNICLASELPICIIWGPGLVQIYNDGYRVICGGKHPRSMGQNFPQCWSDAWPVIGEAHDSALAGDTAFLEDQHIFLDRHGYNEECFFTFSFSPIRSEDGHIGGLFHPVIEMTAKVLGERRTRTLRDLATLAGKAKSIEEAITLSSQTLAPYQLDLPFVLIYLLDRTAQQARLVAPTGLAAGSVACPLEVDLLATGESCWPLGQVALSGTALQVDDLQQRFGAVLCTAYPEAVQAALLLPVTPPGMDCPVAVIVAGISPRLSLDEKYRGFYELLAAAVTSSVANARAHEEEIKRAEALAALDRAKTDFFSNVSHEFRTPLTLLLGPAEELLTMQHGMLPIGAHEQISIVHRNALRLQKLVNTLLDFSRFEASRLRASYQATDLAGVTSELASVFRSAVEKAGMRLEVDCPPLSEPVYVDRDMWEKIVLNLISNAFKFTLEGAITVTLKDAVDAVQLSVRDTGAGIAAEQLPHVFERFHRVEGVRARTNEGTGIGLALVQELVRQHGGTVAVESVLGQGSIFIVTIPQGSSHLPADRLELGGIAVPSALPASHYALEVLRWLPSEDGAAALRDAPPPDPGCAVALPRILLADDNADMRDYVSRLLSERYAVQTVPDGEAALAAARSNPPDLVLADVMMPRLDGLGLLAQLRADPATSSLPVILLSARAGEESRVAGMEVGADDYMVKPFNARELLARVGAQLQLARVRRKATLSLRESEARLRALVTASSDVVYRMSPDWSEMRHLDGRDFIADTKEPHRGWIQEYIHPDDQPRVLEAIGEAIRTKSPFELEHRVRRLDGTLGWTSSRAIPLLDADGGITEWLGTASDITPRKEAAEALGRFAIELAEADRRKNEFLAMLAHELRNPLAPIRNALHIMRLTGGADTAVQSASAMMERQIGQMVRLVDDLLDVSRISRGNIELRKERVELASAIHHAIEAARPFCDAMEHALAVTLPPRSVYVKADPTRLAQVIGNLLNNACKFTDRGGRIALVVERDGEVAVIRVRDNGVGIATEQFPRIFEMFTQIDTSLERSRGGLGIGLTLVKSLVEMHGGTVRVHSAGIYQGSEFVVRLPLLADVPDPLLPEPVPVEAQQGRRILVVDDNRDAATSLAMLLELTGHETRVAHDGLEAVQAAESFRPDVVLLDIGLPKLNGFEVARMMRQQPWGKDMTLVALTGWGQEEDRRMSSEAGFDAHLVKPADPVALTELLAGMRPPGPEKRLLALQPLGRS